MRKWARLLPPLLIFAASAVMAQSVPPPAPGAPDNPSHRLRKSNGVIKPDDRNLDPGIKRRPPKVDVPSKIIPPPGSPGGDPSIQPK